MNQRGLLALSLVIAAGALMTAVPAVGGEAEEIAIARMHAGLAAAEYADLHSLHGHLMSVVNCLIGPSGSGFYIRQGNPCDGKGNGAIPDATSAEQKNQLQAVLATANAGIESRSLDTARKLARDVEGALSGMK
jgi:hypothetical protein